MRDLPTVATAMREEAADFLVKPLDLHQLRAVVERVFRDRAARRGASKHRRRPEDGSPTSPVIVILLVGGFIFLTGAFESDEGPDIELDVPAPETDIDIDVPDVPDVPGADAEGGGGTPER